MKTKKEIKKEYDGWHFDIPNKSFTRGSMEDGYRRGVKFILEWILEIK